MVSCLQYAQFIEIVSEKRGVSDAKRNGSVETKNMEKIVMSWLMPIAVRRMIEKEVNYFLVLFYELGVKIEYEKISLCNRRHCEGIINIGATYANHR